MNLEEKQAAADALRKKFEEAKIVILTDYKGLNVADMTDLRRKLREADVEYSVVKNSLLVRASEGTFVEGIKGDFKGPSAIALSYDDPVAPAKILSKFVETNKKLDIKSGVIAGQVLNEKDVKALSSLPSREVLLAQTLSTMLAVPTSFVRVLNGVPISLLNVLNAIKDDKAEKESAA